MTDFSRDILGGAPISMATFMERVARSYYSSCDPFGSRGDFITAPEVSQMFGEMVGVWAVDLWSKMAKKMPINIVELGPGRGTLMVDALRAGRVVPEFLEAVSIHLVEMSPLLREKQREALSGFDVTHHDDLTTLPQDGFSIVIANEFFDALPVHQLEVVEGEWRERVVTADANFTVDNSSDDLLKLVPDHLREAPDGKVVEVSPERIAVMKQIDRLLSSSEHGGVALIIDYGYERLNYGDTIQAVFGHKFCDVLDHIGEADVSSHVDFGALMQACEHSEVAGVTTQGRFLTAMGIYQRMQALKVNASAEQQANMEAALDRLCSLDKMGQLFKVFCITSDKTIQPAGF